MKIISVRSFYLRAAATLKRFPLSMFLAACITVLYIFITSRDFHISYPKALHAWGRSLYLGFLLSIAAEIFAENRAIRVLPRLILYAACLSYVVLYRYSTDLLGIFAELCRYTALAVSFHLLIAFSILRKNITAYQVWNFNKNIFLRILLAFVYSFVLYLGLSLAILSLDKLFGMMLPYEIYMNLYILILGIFSSWFFLAGVPRISHENEGVPDPALTYPRGLKIFTANILLPLVAIYMVILYLYAIKIIANNSLSDSWVSGMIMAFAVFGILSFLLLHPLGQVSTVKWVARLSKVFYILLMPLAVLMLVTNIQQINLHGVLEATYVHAVLALWLIAIALYSLKKTERNLIMIPVSLCLVGILMSYGPWSMLSVSSRSQRALLKNELERLDLLRNDIVPKNHKITGNQYDLGVVSTKLDYVMDRGGHDALQPLFEENLDSIAGGPVDASLGSSHIYEYLVSKIEEPVQEIIPVEPLVSGSPTTGPVPEVDAELAERQQEDAVMPDRKEYMKHFVLEQNTMLPIEDYDFAGEFKIDDTSEEWVNLKIGKDTLKIKFKNERNVFHVTFRDFVMLSIDPTNKFENLMQQDYRIFDPELLSFRSENKKWAAKVICTRMTLARYNNIDASHITGRLFVKIK